MESTRISGTQAGQAAQGTQSIRGKSPQQAGGPEDSSAQGGFLALLASLGGTMVGEGQPSETAILSPDNPANRGDADPAALAAWQGLLTPGAALAASTADGGAMSGLAGIDWHGATDGLVAQTAMLDGAADAMGAKPPNGAAAGYGRMFSRQQSALLQGKSEVSGGVAPAMAGSHATEKSQTLVTAFAAAQGAQVVVDARMVGGPAAGAGSRGGNDLPGGLSGAEGAAALGLFAESRVPQRGGSATGGEAGGGASGDTAWGNSGAVQAGPETAGVEGAAVFADPSQALAEEQVADQVAYWVNQKTQNAEMTLDRDGQPVQVTVSLSGSEAHVTFRSDQEQTRELLDSSMSQLRELLLNEGLVLAGTTVSTTARDGASANDSGKRQGREDERRTQVVASVPSSAMPTRHSGGAPDSAVDIFV